MPRTAAYYLSRLFRLDLLSLLLWQVANYAIPLMLLPLFGRRLGVTGLGVYGVAMAVMNIGLQVTDWGFLYNSQRAFLAAQGKLAGEHAVIWETITAKLMLAGAYTGVAGAGVLLLDPSSIYTKPILIAIFGLAANVLSMEWLLRARSLFGSFALASVLGRFCSVPLALFWVRGTGDASWAIGATAFGQVAASALSLAIAVRSGLGRPGLRWRGAIARIRDGGALFVSLAATNFYSMAVPSLLGGAGNIRQVGYFAGADRLRGAARMLLYPITIFIYPRINRMRLEQPDQVDTYLLRMLVLFAVSSGFVCGSMLLLARPVIVMLLGPKFEPSIKVLRILAASAFVSSLSSFLATNVLISFDMKNQLLNAQILGISLGTVLIYILASVLGASGAAIGVLLGEALTLMILCAAVTARPGWRAFRTPVCEVTR